MASGGAEGEDGGVPGEVHVLLQEEQEQTLSKGRRAQLHKTVQEPLLIRSTAHQKAERTARSRLEKARLRLQRRIQQAGSLFSGRETTESQLKKKQKALKFLQPALLEDFLAAVEGFGAFCSRAQLQDLVLDCDSVRQQWEEVRREMAAFVDSLKSNMRGGNEPLSLCQSEKVSNCLHEAAEQNEPDSEQQQQAVPHRPSSDEGHEDSLRDWCGSVTTKKTSSLPTNQPTEESRCSETALLPEGGQN